MTDRELLEKAAKAAGYKAFEWHRETPREGGSSVSVLYVGQCEAHRPFRPLEDDGDALRLAVKLDLLHIYRMDSPVWLLHFDATDPDKEGATRRAFVYAAAALAQSAAVGAA